VPKEFPRQSKGFNPFGELIGLEFEEFGGGRSRCALEATGELLNPHGVLHGGVIYSMADTGMGAALYSDLDEDELCTTIEIKITYLRAVKSGRLVCDTRVLSKTRKVAALESEIRSGEELVAKASGTFYIYTSKGAGDDRQDQAGIT
jgi:acyl-CoA thioesterase